MMPQSPGTPDTAAFYRAAYIVITTLLAGYAASLWLRVRRVRDRLRSAGRSGPADA